MRILIGTNLLTEVNASVYANHTALYYHLGRLSVQRDWNFIQMAPTRLSIDRMRNKSAELALNLECDYLVFIDDDMLLQTSTIEKLIDADKDVVMAHTYIRGYPFQPMSFVKKDSDKDIRDSSLRHFDEVVEVADPVTQLAECHAVGFATVAIKTSLLKKLPPPWFITNPDAHTEDIYFCIRCKLELKEEVGIFVHTGVPTNHKLDPEFVGEDNVKELREFYKQFHGKVEELSRKDRDEAYHKMIVAQGVIE